MGTSTRMCCNVVTQQQQVPRSNAATNIADENSMIIDIHLVNVNPSYFIIFLSIIIYLLFIWNINYSPNILLVDIIEINDKTCLEFINNEARNKCNI